MKPVMIGSSAAPISWAMLPGRAPAGQMVRKVTADMR